MEGERGEEELYEMFKKLGLSTMDFSIQKQLESGLNQQKIIPNVSFQHNYKQVEEAVRQRNQREEEYKQKVLEALMSIQKNTANLSEIVFC
ncbi:MAG: hypothetical protein KGZ94_02115 [Clostridia bacterium]|jgi:hypothetical protein|nr:hypothetical protein [Clostridia bacterium]